jgi:hypothetical protein
MTAAAPDAAPPVRLPRRCDVLVAGRGPAGATDLQARFAFAPRRPQVYLFQAAGPPPAREALAAPVEAGA